MEPSRRSRVDVDVEANEGCVRGAGPSQLEAVSFVRGIDVELPELPDVPGMVTAAERRYLYWLTSHCYSGDGAVVEVGSWLGCSTIHLAAGLEDDQPIYCFDRFVWHRSQDDKIPSSLVLEHGDDTLPVFLRHVRPVHERVIPVKTDVEDLAWHGDPVEILFLDAPKQPADVEHVFAEFAGSLIPGRSLVVLQDYQFAPAYTLVAATDLLRGGLRLEHVLDASATATFRVVAPVDPAAVAGQLDPSRWSAAEIREAWRRVRREIPGAVWERMALGEAMMLYDAGHKRAAREAGRRADITPALLEKIRRYESLPSLQERYEALFLAWRGERVRAHAREFASWSERTMTRLRKNTRKFLGRWARRIFRIRPQAG